MTQFFLINFFVKTLFWYLHQTRTTNYYSFKVCYLTTDTPFPKQMPSLSNWENAELENLFFGGNVTVMNDVMEHSTVIGK